MSVELHVDAGLVIAPRLRSRFHREVERMIKAVALREQRPNLRLGLRLCGDAALCELDRGPDAPTGVLAFPAAGDDGWLGELAISFETANRNAKEKVQSLHTELLLLASLGICTLVARDAPAQPEVLQARASALRYEALRPGKVKPA